jgi:dihydroorotase
VNPPIRTQWDVDTVINGIEDNTIDAIATDHAPHSIEEKDVEFDQAPPGMIGLETAIGLVFTFLVKKGHLSLEDMVDKMAIAPRRILNLTIPEIKVGEVANFSILDPDIEWTVDQTKFRSRSSNSPFVGWKLVGKSFGVYNNGRWFQNLDD